MTNLIKDKGFYLYSLTAYFSYEQNTLHNCEAFPAINKWNKTILPAPFIITDMFYNLQEREREREKERERKKESIFVFCLFGDFFIYVETSLLPVKDCKF